MAFGADTGIWIQCRRAGGANRDYDRVLAQKMRPHERDRTLGKLAREKAQRILAETYAETVVIGWQGITDRQGTELPFTKENVIKVLTDLPDLFNELQIAAVNYRNFLMGAVELVGEDSGDGSNLSYLEASESVA